MPTKLPEKELSLWAKLTRSPRTWIARLLMRAASRHTETASRRTALAAKIAPWLSDGEKVKTAARRGALESAGVEFTNGGQPGVKIREGPMELSSTHIGLLRRLAEKPGMSVASVPPACHELERAGYVTITAGNLQDLYVEITDAGRAALAASADSEGP